MPILFCNTAWMKYYAGRSAKDPPLGGGDFPVSEGYCGEECNFVHCADGYVYGHFETGKNGVDIVWTAPTEGNDPRAVVGWSRNARLYRRRQLFNDQFPSAQHHKDNITSYQVRARATDVVLLPPGKRTLKLQRGRGWSGQASWWYAEESSDPGAIRFVQSVKALITGQTLPPLDQTKNGRSGGRNDRAGAAASKAYQRYLSKYEVKVHPRHSKLEKRFKAYLKASHASISFPDCYRDDLRYKVPGEPAVMVEVKPSDPASVRFAIRTAIGQLLDYRQQQQWIDNQLVLVEAEVANVEDLLLAHDNGFGIAWPDGINSFTIRWPEPSRKSA